VEKKGARAEVSQGYRADSTRSCYQCMNLGLKVSLARLKRPCICLNEKWVCSRLLEPEPVRMLGVEHRLLRSVDPDALLVYLLHLRLNGLLLLAHALLFSSCERGGGPSQYQR
jgi:hypothetical protein